MIAKVIAWAPTAHRGGPPARRQRWRRAEIHGLRTNRDLLVEVLRHPDFLAGDDHDAFLATEP